MLTQYRRQLFNYCLDVALEKYSEHYKTDVDLSEEKVRSAIVEKFAHTIVIEEDREVKDSIMSGKRHIRVDDDLIKCAIYCLETAMTRFHSHFRKIAKLDLRLHRVKIRSIFIQLLSQKYRDTQLEGLKNAQRQIKQEKEKLMYEGL